MKSTKKSQISLFLIVGLVLLLVVSLFVVVRINMKRADVQQVKQESITFQNLEEDAGLYVEDCIEQSVFEGIENYGLDSPGILEVYVGEQIMICTDEFKIYENIAEISEEEPVVNVEINDDIINFNIDYPVIFSKGEEQFRLKKFSYSFRTNTLIDSDGGIIEEGTVYTTEDGRLNLYFSDDTTVTKDGDSVDAISLNVEDEHINGLSNAVVIGSVLYEGLPHGAKFNPAIEVTVELDEEDIQGLDTSALKLAYYDDDADLWITYPSYFDEENMVVRGKVDHFSLISVSMCGSSVDGQATMQMSTGEKTFPMEFIFKDPFLDGEDNGCNPTHWMYNSLEDDEHGSYGFHLLPEFMSSFECEYDNYDMTTYYYGEEFPVDVCDLNSEHIRDWDNDDDPAYEFGVGEIKISFSGIENPQEFTLFAEMSSDQSKEVYTYLENKCVSAASAFAKEKIKEKFDWVTDDLISGDGIRDGATLHCTADLSGTEGDTLDSFMGRVAIGSIGVQFNEGSITDNLENPDSICWGGGKCSPVQTIEDYGDGVPLVPGATKTRLGFFATPKTFGFAFEQQEPFQVLTTYEDIGAIKDDVDQTFHPLLGEGEFTFYLRTGGDACVSYEPSGLGCCVNSQQVGDETVITDCQGKPDENGCRGEFFDKDCHELSQCIGKTNDLEAFLIQEEVEVENYILKSTPSNIITIASQAGSTPIKNTIATDLQKTQGETDLSVANDDEYLPLVYDMSKIEGRDWSCSDTCLWTINEEPGKILSETTQQKTKSTPASPGKLRSGTNTVKVRVANLNDVCMYARAFLQLKGQGVTFFDISEDVDRPLTEDDCKAVDSCWVSRPNIENGGFCVVKGENNGGYCCFGAEEGNYMYPYPHFEYFGDQECKANENARPMDELSCTTQGGKWTNGFCVRAGEYNAEYCVVGPTEEKNYVHYELAEENICPCEDGRECLVASECEVVDEYHSVRCSQTEQGERMYCCDRKEPEEEVIEEEPVGQLSCSSGGNAIIDDNGKRFSYCTYGCNPGQDECKDDLMSCQNSVCYSDCSTNCDSQADDYTDCLFTCQENCPECYSEIDCEKFPNYETTEWKCEGSRVVPQTCGDGNLDPNEECDDGNNDDGDGCNAECILEYCGDGLINNVDEECDDGDTVGLNGCSDTCQIEDGWTCDEEPSVCVKEEVTISDVQRDKLEKEFPGTRIGNAQVLSQMITTCYELYYSQLKSDLYECLDNYAPNIGQINQLSSDAWPYTFTTCAVSEPYLQCLCYVNAFGVASGYEVSTAYGLVGVDSNLEEYTGESQLATGKYVIFGDSAPGHIAYIVGQDSEGDYLYTDANSNDVGGVVYGGKLKNHPRGQITYISKVPRT